MKITATLTTDVTFDTTKEIEEAIKKVQDAALKDDDAEYDFQEDILFDLIKRELRRRNFKNITFSDTNVLDANWD
jgi:hypothetical protein